MDTKVIGRLVGRSLALLLFGRVLTQVVWIWQGEPAADSTNVILLIVAALFCLVLWFRADAISKGCPSDAGEDFSSRITRFECAATLVQCVALYWIVMQIAFLIREYGAIQYWSRDPVRAGENRAYFTSDLVILGLATLLLLMKRRVARVL